jgi:hypothetical protein
MQFILISLKYTDKKKNNDIVDYFDLPIFFYIILF